MTGHMYLQKKIGNNYEQLALKKLQQQGWWCHLFSYNKNGQPCDIIACKDNKVMLIDVKHCNSKTFSFNRLEVNQRNCFKYFQMCGNSECYLMIYFEQEKDFYMLSFNDLLKAEQTGDKSVNVEKLRNENNY